MADVLLRMLCGATLGIALALLLRRPARRVFGAGAAFMLWLLPLVLALAPLLPEQVAPHVVIAVPGLSVTPHVAPAAAVQRATLDWMHWLVAIWLVGAGGGLLRLALHYARLLRGLRRAPSAWARMLADAAPQLDPRRVRVHAAGPAVVWALPRSLILLPADFARRFGNVPARALVLRHEFTHARRGDALWSLAMEVASALLWFHPLTWLARPRFRLDQELACDAASLRALPQHAAGYARALLDSVAAQPAPALIPWLAEPQLKERLAMLARIPPGALRRRAGFVAVATVLAGGLYVAGGRAPLMAATPTSGFVPPSVDVTWKQEHLPRYPVEALRKGQQGLVILDVTINAAGRIVGVAVDPKGTTAPTVLQAAAVAAARDWKFRPGEQAGKSVGGVVRVPVNFALSPAGDSAAAVARPAPAYPETALRQGEHGTVMLKVHVDAAGRAEQVTVDAAQSTTDSAALIAAAKTAAQHWQFTPDRKNGKSVDGWIEIPVTFSLGAAKSATH